MIIEIKSDGSKEAFYTISHLSNEDYDRILRALYRLHPNERVKADTELFDKLNTMRLYR